MPEKQITNNKEGPKPNQDKVAQELARIEMATIEEEEERRSRGLTQEPAFFRQEKRAVDPPLSDEEILRKFGGNTDTIEMQMRQFLIENENNQDFAEAFRAEFPNAQKAGELLEQWEAKHPNYEVSYFDPNTTEISNETNITIPPEFIDFLLDSFHRTDSDAFLDLTDLTKIKITHFGDTSNLIILWVKDTENKGGILFFEGTPPFKFLRVETFKGVSGF